MATPGLDHIDRKILSILQDDGRITVKQLAFRVALSSPATGERLRRLEESKFIKGYQVELSDAALGLTISGMVRLYSTDPNCGDVAMELSKIPEVTDCFLVSGEETAIVIVKAKSLSDFDRVIGLISKYGRTISSIILSESHYKIAL